MRSDHFTITVSSVSGSVNVLSRTTNKEIKYLIKNRMVKSKHFITTIIFPVHFIACLICHLVATLKKINIDELNLLLLVFK